MLMRKRCTTAAAILSATVSAGAVADSDSELGYSFDLLGGYSDNILRSRDHRQDESMAGAGLQFLVDQKTRRLDATALADLQYVDYLDNTFDSELKGIFKGTALLDLIPERLRWSFTDNFGQVPRRTADPDTPDNRESINIAATGPNLMFHFTRRTALELAARYSNVYYEDTDIDNDRTQESVAISRELSGVSTISLNAAAEQIKFDHSEVAEDFDRNEAFARYEAAGGRTLLALDLGYSEVKGDDFSSDDTLARLEVRRQISPASTLLLEAGHVFSDAANSFQQLQTIDQFNQSNQYTQPVQEEPGPYLSKYVTFGWHFEQHITHMGVTLSHFDDGYERQPEADRQLNTVGAYFERKVGGMSSLRVEGDYARQEIKQTNRVFADVGARIVWYWQVGARLFMSCEYGYNTRHDDLATNEYHESHAFIRLGYRSVGFESLL